MKINEFHNITPLENISSILNYGILSHNRAYHLKRADVSMLEIQERRANVQIPNGLMLHQYANLYFDARNPMMHKRKDLAQSLCVLSISTDVLKINGVVITDQNASSGYVRFMPANDIDSLDLDYIYAEDWNHSDEIAKWKHKSAKCAEVLVPHSVSCDFIQKAYVINNAVEENLKKQGFKKDIEVYPKLFFR